MKSFYEMMIILEGLKNGDTSGYREWGYHDGPEYDEEEINYSRLLIGEDDDSFCSAEVSGTDSAWSLDPGGVFVRDYVPTGKENPISKPKYQEPEGRSRGGTEFGNPGENFKNLPPDLARKCFNFIDAEVRRYIGSYTPDDPRDSDESRDRKWDAQDQAAYDRSLWLGGEKY